MVTKFCFVLRNQKYLKTITQSITCFIKEKDVSSIVFMIKQTFIQHIRLTKLQIEYKTASFVGKKRFKIQDICSTWYIFDSFMFFI